MNIKRYQPVPYKLGNKVIKKYTEPYSDGAGHTGIATYVDYYNHKQKKVITKYFLRIRWDNNV